MAVTIQDIAKDVGVVKSTVSTVLNNSRSSVRVSQKTRERVMEAVERLNYRPSFLAKSLASGKTATLGFVCGGISNPNFSELVAAILQEAEERKHHLLIAVTDWDTEKELLCLDSLLARRVDGIIVATNCLRADTRQYQDIVREKLPIVLLGTMNETGIFSSVVVDMYPGMDEAVSLLQKCGHDRIGFISMDQSLSHKQKAFRRACQKYGITSIDYFCESSELFGIAKFGCQLAKSDFPRALIANSDYMAMGIINGLRQGGLNVPCDVDIIGIDGTELAAYATPAIASIYQDRRKIAESAVNILLEMGKDPSLSPVKITIPSWLIVRESVMVERKRIL